MWDGGSMKEEIDSLRKNKTWELVDHPAGQKLVSCKWLFKIKERIKGVQKPRYMARLVACGFTQRVGIDYNEVFSPVVRHTSIRFILALTAYKDYELEQLDRSHRQWYRRFDDYMLSNGFKRSSYDSYVYYRSYAPGEYIYLLLYVDDMPIACKSKAEIGSTKSLLKKEFAMKELGEAKKILGMEIVRDQSRKILRVSQSRDCDLEKMSKVPYTNAVRSLMYLMVCMRPDIAYSGCVVSWKATLQHVVALSTIEAEYMALVEAVKEAIWLRGLLEELVVKLNTVAVNCDNQGAIHLSRNHVFHERTKHINVHYHFIREVLEAKTVEVLKVGTKHNVADALTNVVPRLKLQHCLEFLSVGVG
ncbi:retrovirus-related pol polyprotein from transposon TNT 1-94 [Tanacetum coccineum]